jgi:hypothetical protein
MKRLFGIALAAITVVSVGAQAPKAPDIKNLRVIGQNTLNGKGNGGEGLDLVQYPDGRRVLFYAHTAARPA